MTHVNYLLPFAVRITMFWEFKIILYKSRTNTHKQTNKKNTAWNFEWWEEPGLNSPLHLVLNDWEDHVCWAPWSPWIWGEEKWEIFLMLFVWQSNPSAWNSHIVSSASSLQTLMGKVPALTAIALPVNLDWLFYLE